MKTFQNTKVGGLSGIDYDVKMICITICDDRSMFNDSFLHRKIRLFENKSSWVFISVTTLK
jgi:hypothetical protein